MLERAGVLEHFHDGYDGESDIQLIIDSLDTDMDGKVKVQEAFEQISNQIWMFGNGLENKGRGESPLDQGESVLPTAE